MDDSFERLYDLYYQYKREYLKMKDDPSKKKESKSLLKDIESIKIKVDEKEINIEDKLDTNKNYISFPDYHDPDFIYEITRKAEFFHCKNMFDVLDLSNKCNSDYFSLGNHQIFLKNFINRNTPYKSLLIFHGVGVGKTCSAITISNSFVDLYKSEKQTKKIICLVSKNIQNNWRDTIYNPNKTENQCTGNTYQDIINNIDSKSSKEKIRNKVIKNYYEFYGYQEFSNKVKNMIKVYLKNKDVSEYSPEELISLERKAIKNYFSDRLFIIDEVHNLRDENINKQSKNESRDVLKYIDKVLTYSENLRLVIMSATPMFNKVTEIQWILNMLLKNDKRPLLKKNDLFNKKGKLNIEKLRIKSKGYISYLRGENPITFPIRLYPDINKDKNCICKKNKNYPINDLWGNRFPDKYYQFKDLKMYYSQMIDDYQGKIYEKFIESLPNVENLSLNDQKRGVQISNIVYPPIELLTESISYDRVDLSNVTSGNAFLKLMKKGRKKYSYSSRYLSNVEPRIGSLFSLNNLSKISTKLNNILTGIKNNKTDGIIFIYTEYIICGAIPLSLALEHMGFEKYSGNILDYPEWNTNNEHTKDEPLDYEFNPISSNPGGKRAKYIVLSGQKDLSPNNDEEIKVLTHPDNFDGSNIKVVIGSAVTSEGLDFKNIREIHILDPWFHLYKIEQIIGRGIRFCSHQQLLPKERNVTVFLHASGKDPKNESIDTYTYRIAEKKASEIGKVEMVLKSNAIDCYLNKTVNHISEKNISPISIVTSRNRTAIPKHYIHDQPYSKVCSFSEKCDFDCNTISKIKENDIKYDTFNPDISKELFKPIERIIKELYEIKNYYTLNDLENKILDTIDTNIYFIYFCLDSLVKQKICIWNKNEISGYLIQISNYYIFQPHSNNDKLLPLYYREIDSKLISQKYIQLKDDLFSSEYKKKEIKIVRPIFEDIITKINRYVNTKSGLVVEHRFGEKVSKKIFKYSNIFPDEKIPYKENVFFDFYIEGLSYLEKVVLLNKIVGEKIIKKKFSSDINGKIFHYFEKNLISKDKKNNYNITNDGELCGFYLFDHMSFYNKKIEKKKILDDISNDYSFYIFSDTDFYDTNDLEENGEIIKDKILKNIRNNLPQFNFDAIWSYSFRSDKEKRVLRFVNEKSNLVSQKLPGKVIEDISQIDSVKEYLKDYFPQHYKLYLKREMDKDKISNSKIFISIYIEIIMRSLNYSHKDMDYFIPYDIFMLKYIE